MAPNKQKSTVEDGSADLEFYFLDVGRGDGTLIVFPSFDRNTRKTMLVDLGSQTGEGESETDKTTLHKDLKKTIDTVFENPGLNKKIDYLVLTHADADHYNLIVDLLKNPYTFGEIYYGGELNDYNRSLRDVLDNKINNIAQQLRHEGACHDEICTPWIHACKNHDYVKYQKEEKCPFPRLDVHVLAANIGPTKNSKSIVLRFAYAGKRAILCADAEASTETAIVDKYYKEDVDFLRADVLKLAHHGGRHSSLEGWLKETKPHLVAMSADTHDGYKHPHVETIERAKPTLCNMYEHQALWYTGDKKEHHNEPDETHAILTSLVGENQDQGVCYLVFWGADGAIHISDTLTDRYAEALECPSRPGKRKFDPESESATSKKAKTF